MIITDFHSHIFPDTVAQRAIASMRLLSPFLVNRTDGTVRGLRASMKEHGIGRSVLLAVATRPDQVSSINRHAVQVNDAATVAFGTLFPGAPGWESEISFMTEKGIRGVKLHPEYQEFHVDSREYFPMYEALQAAGLIVVLHAGWDPGPFTNDHGLPPAVRAVHDAFPGLTLVAAHMGGLGHWDEAEECLGGTDVFLDTSAVNDTLPPDTFIRIVRRRGAERVLFGSDSPWFDQGEAARWIDGMPLTSGEKELILSGNAERLLGEERRESGAEPAAAGDLDA